MSVTVQVSDEQLAEAGAVFLTEHEKVMLIGGTCTQRIMECFKSARRDDNYTWNNSEGAGAAWFGLLTKVDPGQAHRLRQRYGQPYSWRRDRHMPDPDGEWVDGENVGRKPWPEHPFRTQKDCSKRCYAHGRMHTLDCTGWCEYEPLDDDEE